MKDVLQFYDVIEQLAHKVGGGVKAELEDLSANTLAAIDGTGGPFDVLSVPQNKSVNRLKVDNEINSIFDNIYDVMSVSKPLTIYDIYSSNASYEIESNYLKMSKLAETTYTYASVVFLATCNEFSFKFIKTETLVLIGGSDTDFTGMWIGSTNIKLANLGESGVAEVLSIDIPDTPVTDDLISFRWSGNNLVAKKNGLDWFELDFNEYPQYYAATVKRFGAITTETTRRTIMKDVNIVSLNNRIDESKIESVSQYEGEIWNAVGDSVTARNQYQPIVANEFGFEAPINYGVSGANIAQKIGYLDGESFVECIPSIPDADLWTVFDGYNDWATARSLGDINSTDPVTFYGALYIICENILTRPNKPRLILVTPAQSNPNGVADMTGLTMLDYVNAMKAIGQYYSIKVVDFYSYGGINPLNSNYYTDDGLHPNATYGMPLIADNFIKAIKDI